MEFYQSIAIKSGPDWELAKDIKDVWDSSRFSHAPALAQQNPELLISQIKEWIGENPYRYGPNWVNPMEVAIRAMNWIYAMAQIAPKNISAELISCSLYDHFVYLEHNWEFYDGRTNNHYLSNLVGYLACCWYFMPLDTQKKAQWATKELLREMQKTVFPEGTSYEGSTAYHGLVTELYEHGFYFVKLLGLSVPEWAQERHGRMQEFARLTKNLHIGDNDIREVSKPVRGECFAKQNVSNHTGYKNFGLTIHEDPIFRISLRHHSYKLRQPSGHFHSDANSITVSIGNMPLFVDPGTYVYTPSIPWRNYFRAMRNHNTYMLGDIEPVPLTNNLWKLELPTHNTLYKNFGVTPHRTFEVSGPVLAIVDQWRARMPLPLLPPTTWNFTLAPAIEPRITEHGVEFLFEKKPLATLNSPTISWSLTDGWYAPCYGQKIATQQLRGQQETRVGTKTLLTLVAQ